MALFHTKEAGGFKSEDTCMFTVLGNTGVRWERREISFGSGETENPNLECEGVVSNEQCSKKKFLNRWTERYTSV